jgi:hypothetical protein
MTSDIARGLIRSAARRAPDPLSERLTEEWLADLSAQRGSLSRLRFAIGCYWAARVITQEHSAPELAIARPAIATARAHFIRFPQEGSPVLMSGTTTFALILALNAAVFYGLVLGLSAAA